MFLFFIILEIKRGYVELGWKFYRNVRTVRFKCEDTVDLYKRSLNRLIVFKINSLQKLSSSSSLSMFTEDRIFIHRYLL